MEEVQVTKTDKELIQERINELKEGISNKKKSGKTYKKINAIIEDFFNQPMGKKIALSDTESPKDFDDLKAFIQKVTTRLRNDFPDTNYRITYPSPKQAFLERRTETYKEMAEKRLAQWEEKLKEFED